MAGDSVGTLRGALLGLLAAGVGLATSFGLSLSDKQQASILVFGGAAAVVGPFVGALFDHSAKQAAARQVAATTIAEGPAAVQLSPVEQLQAQIDALTAQRDKLG
jgi:hypothetical protein